MIPTPVEAVYNSRERLWCLTFDHCGFVMYFMYDDVNNHRYNQEWGSK